MEERISACIGELLPVLEKSGHEEFIEAVQCLLNSHPTTKPITNRSYQVLILPEDYDSDALWRTMPLHSSAGVAA